MVHKIVNILSWRLLMDRIHVRSSLEAKGVNVSSTLCPLCQQNIETTRHLFVDYDIANKTWKLIIKWLDLDIHVHLSPSDLLKIVIDFLINVKKTQILEAVLQTTWWIIWRYGNELSRDIEMTICLMIRVSRRSSSWVIYQSCFSLI